MQFIIRHVSCYNHLYTVYKDIRILQEYELINLRIFFFIRYTCKMIRRKKDIYKTLYWEHCALFILGEKENIPFNTENKILKRTLHFFGRLINLKCKMQTTSYTLLSYWECINFNLKSQLIINKAILSLRLPPDPYLSVTLPLKSWGLCQSVRLSI